MVNKSGNGKQLMGSQLGYQGKGVPDWETITALQKNYSPPWRPKDYHPKSALSWSGCEYSQPRHSAARRVNWENPK